MTQEGRVLGLHTLAPMSMRLRLSVSFLSLRSLFSLLSVMTVRCSSSIMVFLRLRDSRALMRFCSRRSLRLRVLASSSVSPGRAPSPSDPTEPMSSSLISSAVMVIYYVVCFCSASGMNLTPGANNQQEPIAAGVFIDGSRPRLSEKNRTNYQNREG